MGVPCRFDSGSGQCRLGSGRNRTGIVSAASAGLHSSPAPFRSCQKPTHGRTSMKHLFTTALFTAAIALPLTAVAQERYPELKMEQLNPAQKAYVESLQKPPRNNTTALKNPPFKVYMRSPELASKLEAMSDYVRWGTGLQPRLT